MPAPLNMHLDPGIRSRLPAMLTASVVVAFLVGAASSGASDVRLGSLGNDYFVRFSGRVLFNVRASVQSTYEELPAGYYQNGFVLPDISGAQSDLTWNWGYQSASQVANDQLDYSRYNNLALSGVSDLTSPSPGGEIMAGARLGAFRVGKREVEYGVEIGYGFNGFEVSGGYGASSTATYTEDAYKLNGITPPPAPYAGSFEGPGPLIDLNPTMSSVSAATSTVMYNGDLTSGLHNFKFGFWFDYPITPSFYTSLSLGYSSIYADTQLQFTENVSFSDPTIPALNTSSTVGGRDWKSGIYAQWRLGYELTESLRLYIAADYQWNDKFRFSGAGQEVTLDFTNVFAASAGLQFSF